MSAKPPDSDVRRFLLSVPQICAHYLTAMMSFGLVKVNGYDGISQRSSLLSKLFSEAFLQVSKESYIFDSGQEKGKSVYLYHSLPAQFQRCTGCIDRENPICSLRWLMWSVVTTWSGLAGTTPLNQLN